MEISHSGTQRWLEVAPDRITGWLESFADRHTGARYDARPDDVVVRAGDGTDAR